MFFLQPSQKRLLSSFNPLFLVLFVFLVILFRSTSEAFLPGWFRQWEILLPFMVYFGQRRTLPEGIILSLFTSHLFSLCSSAPIGVFTSQSLVIFVVARLVSYAIYANSGTSIFFLLLGLAVLSRITLTAVAALFGHGWPLFVAGNFSLWAILVNALGGFLVYRFIEVLDRMTFKVPRINIELAEEGL